MPFETAVIRLTVVNMLLRHHCTLDIVLSTVFVLFLSCSNFGVVLSCGAVYDVAQGGSYF